MAHCALVISKDELDLDSRFAWTSSLATSTTDYSNEPVIILHSSSDDVYKLLEGLSKLRVMGCKKKFLYISNSIDPLLFAFFDGIGGVVFDEEYPLSDASILISLIDEYTESDFRLKSASEEFVELKKVLQKITAGNLDEEELHSLLTSPVWLKQVNACINEISTALVRVDTSNKTLVKYTDHSRDVLTKLKEDMAKMKVNLEDALKQSITPVEEESSSSKNTVTYFPSLSLPLGTCERVLYVKEYSPCTYLTSFLQAYSSYLRNKLGVANRLLLVQHASKIGLARYPDDSFYAITPLSLNSKPPAGKNSFITTTPTNNIMNFFFSNADIKTYIVIDRMYQDNQMFRSGPKIHNLYATGNISLMTQRNINMNYVITSNLDPNFQFSGLNIPSIAKYRDSVNNHMGLYFSACKNLFQRLDEILGIKVTS